MRVGELDFLEGMHSFCPWGASGLFTISFMMAEVYDQEVTTFIKSFNTSHPDQYLNHPHSELKVYIYMKSFIAKWVISILVNLRFKLM